jgi:hypothetical protein
MLASMLAHVVRRSIVSILVILLALLVQRFAPKTFWSLVSLILGLLMGIFFHYLIYRFTLPAKPFVYVAF